MTIAWDSLNWNSVLGRYTGSLHHEKYLDRFKNDYIKHFNMLSEAFTEYKHDGFDKDLCSQASKIPSYKFEMEVGLFFKTHEKRTQIKLQKTPSKEAMPDLFLYSDHGQKLWVECVAPEKGSVTDYAVPDVDTTKPTPCHERQSLTRLADALCGSYTEGGAGRCSEGKIAQYIKRLTGACSPDDLYLIAISGADLDLCLNPIFLFDAFAKDISDILSGDPFYIRKNSQIDFNDFETGILGLGCAEGKDQTRRTIRPFQIVPKPENLGILLFVNGKLASPEVSDCCLFCISRSPFVEIAKTMQVYYKVVRI